MLADASPPGPWRSELGLDEPSAQLAAAIESMGRTIGAATPTQNSPTVDALVPAVRNTSPGERGLDALAGRVLRSALESRLARSAIGG